MPLPKQKQREITFQLLYCMDFADHHDKELISSMMKLHNVSKKWVILALDLAKEIKKRLVDIDKKISSASTEYEFKRIPRIERNLLRLCVYGLLYDEDLPNLVVIAEGIRLSRKFCTRQSASFVNAILDAISKQHADVLIKEA